MKVANRDIIRKITKRVMRSDKRRNFFIIAAIALTTFMIASVFSIGFSVYESINMREKRLQGSVSNMAFAMPTEEQLEKVYTLDYVKTVGIGAFVAQTPDMPKLAEMLDIAFVDETQWNEMFCPAFTNIIGNYPERENEIMLSRYILEAMKIENPSVGMEIPLTYIVNGRTEAIHKTFILSCVYTEYAHSGMGGGGFSAVYASRAFAEEYNKLTVSNVAVNVIFKDERNVPENIERLKQDLSFSDSQPFTVSPAFDDNTVSAATLTAIFTITIFLMLTGYLLIYNVMYISVSKDIRFYGLLKTIGTTPKQLQRIVSGQVSRLCLIALPAGCVAAGLVSLLIVPAVISNSGIETGAAVSFSPMIYFGATLFAVLTAFLGALTPAKKAADISPIEAMKYTGLDKPLKISSVHSKANGKPHRMAIRNIFRDHKRAAIVMLSLFLGIVVFTSVITIVGSMDIEYRLQSEYEYDFSIRGKGNSPSLDMDFITAVKALDGISEAGIISLGIAEIVYSGALEHIIDFNAGNFLIVVRGIDRITIDRINKTLPVPIDADAFERGEIAFINIENTDEQIANALNPGSILHIKYGDTYLPVTLNKALDLKLRSNYVLVADSDARLEIITSNALLQQVFIPEPRIQVPLIVQLHMNVVNGCDEQVNNALDRMINPQDMDMTSRYEARAAMQGAETIMYILGGGVSLILGFIGIINFINVMSVGVMARKRELAMLESIGMTKRQVRSMLRNEGLGYAIITIACTLTLGTVITYTLFLLFKGVVTYAEFSYPLIPCAAVLAAIAIICLTTSEIVYKGISKMTLAERLREVE